MKRRRIFFLFSLIVVSVAAFLFFTKYQLNLGCEVGDPVDSLNGVVVYFNGDVSNTSGRTTSDGYNIGVKYQCVEFVKRYYYQRLHHKMPDPFGNAKDFFNADLADGQRNKARGLVQYKNGSKTRPAPDDLLVFDATAFNSYGHVAIISSVSKDEIEIIQQNPGRFGRPRDVFSLEEKDGKWTIGNDKILGWLRKE